MRGRRAAPTLPRARRRPGGQREGGGNTCCTPYCVPGPWAKLAAPLLALCGVGSSSALPTVPAKCQSLALSSTLQPPFLGHLTVDGGTGRAVCHQWPQGWGAGCGLALRHPWLAPSSFTGLGPRVTERPGEELSPNTGRGVIPKTDLLSLCALTSEIPAGPTASTGELLIVVTTY